MLDSIDRMSKDVIEVKDGEFPFYEKDALKETKTEKIQEDLAIAQTLGPYGVSTPVAIEPDSILPLDNNAMYPLNPLMRALLMASLYN